MNSSGKWFFYAGLFAHWTIRSQGTNSPGVNYSYPQIVLYIRTGTIRVLDCLYIRPLISWTTRICDNSYSLRKNCSSDTGRRDVYAIRPAPRIFNERNIFWTWVCRTLITQGSVSQGLVLIGCGQLVVYIYFLQAVAIRPAAGRQIMQAIRPAVLPDDKLCRLFVRHCCRTTSYVGYQSGTVYLLN